MKAVIAAGHIIPPSLSPATPLRTFHFPSQSSLKSKIPTTNFTSNTFRRFVCAAGNNNGNGNEGNEFDGGDRRSNREGEKENGLNGNGNGNGNGRPRLNMKWVDMLVNPDPDNVVAVGLTGLLAWASVQVLWQLFVISIAIVLAALKYSFVAALLIFILITLL